MPFYYKKGYYSRAQNLKIRYWDGYKEDWGDWKISFSSLSQRYLKFFWVLLVFIGIKDFSKIANSLRKILEIEVKFVFDDASLKAFECLKEQLILSPIIVSLDWSILFEVMYDASKLALVSLNRSVGKCFTKLC